jgi:NAD(P)H-dependent FMN reductase
VKLHIWLCSVRPGRNGAAIARWFHDLALKNAKFETQLVDLAEVALPLMDEAEHPRFGKYQHAHTKAWSALCSEADAFVFVAPEYNFGFTAPWKNAIDYLSREWLYKPCAFVSYGGPAGGTRMQQQAKQVVTALKMMPMYESVTVPFFTQHLKEGVFAPPEGTEKAAHLMLDELARWTEAMRPLRA